MDDADGDVLCVASARALRHAGLQWTAARGHSFVMAGRNPACRLHVHG